MSGIEHQPGRAKRRRWRVACGVVLSALAVGLGVAAFTLHFLYVRHAFCAVVPGQVYRSGQPPPDVLRRWVRRHGLKTIINLRGRSDEPFHVAERRAADELGVRLVDVGLSAHYLPTKPAILRLARVLETAERPILLHCAQGLDRSDLASVLAAMAVNGDDYAAARRRMIGRCWRFGPLRRKIFGLLAEYEAHCRREGLGTGGWQQFRTWLADAYYPRYFHAEIAAPSELRAHPGRIVRAAVTVTNRSRTTIPAGRDGTTLQLLTFRGPRTDDWPAEGTEMGATPLPARDIPPGGTVQFVHTFRAPAQLGRHTIHFDLLIEEPDGGKLFGREGSPVAACTLTVGPAPGAQTAPATGGSTGSTPWRRR